jgi:hypothetical protein
MTVQRNRSGTYVDLLVKAKQRILPTTGRVLVPYQAEWGRADYPVAMANIEERFAETGLLVDELELAAENGATVIGYRFTNGNGVAAKHTIAGLAEIIALYAGTKGNDITVLIRQSVDVSGKKEIVIKDKKGIFLEEIFIFGTVDELVLQLQKSKMVRGKKIGDGVVSDLVTTSLIGGVTGTASLTAADYTKLFNKVNGETFDAIHIPSTDAAIHAAAKQWLLDRRRNERKLSTMVIGGKIEEDADMSIHITRSNAANAGAVINNSISGKHANGKIYSSVQWAAWVAGLAAGTPANRSLTNVPVPLMEATADWGYTDIIKGLSEGVLMAVKDGGSYVIEKAVNTLTTLGANEREDFGKIRVWMTLDQILNDINSVGRKLKGKLDNDPDGQGIFIGSVQGYLDERSKQKAIAQDWEFFVDPDKISEFDFGFFKLKANPLDALEEFYITWEM